MAKKNKILLTGIGGFLAPFLYDEFIKDYNITTTGRSHGDIGCDLEDERQIAMLLADSSPDIIIHTATFYGRNKEDLKQITESNFIMPFHYCNESA